MQYDLWLVKPHLCHSVPGIVWPRNNDAFSHRKEIQSFEGQGGNRYKETFLSCSLALREWVPGVNLGKRICEVRKEQAHKALFSSSLFLWMFTFNDNAFGLSLLRQLTWATEHILVSGQSMPLAGKHGRALLRQSLSSKIFVVLTVLW